MLVTHFNTHRHPLHRRRRPAILDEVEHALKQLELQSIYPGREPSPPILPQSEWSPWPSIYDKEE
jgi:hypothetical protein